MPLVLLKIESMYSDKSVPVANVPLVIFIGGPTNQRRTGNIQGAWDPEILVAVITMVGVPVEEALVDIVMNSRKVMIHLECERKEKLVR